jgi:hypothetical protein
MKHSNMTKSAGIGKAPLPDTKDGIKQSQPRKRIFDYRPRRDYLVFA